MCAAPTTAPAENARNPIIHADVPDIAIIRVDGTYYMSSIGCHVDFDYYPINDKITE